MNLRRFWSALDFRRRIKTAAAPRITASDAPGAKPNPDETAIIFDRLSRVLTTTWIIPAKSVRVKPFEDTVIGAYGFLVNSDRSDCNAFTHLLTSSSKSANFKSRLGGLAITTMSQFVRLVSWGWKALRALRRNRFRFVARLENFLLTMIARRPGFFLPEIFLKARTLKKTPCQPTPLSKARLMCRLRRRRFSFFIYRLPLGVCVPSPFFF